MHAEERIRCYVHVYLCLNRKKWEGKRERDRELIVLRGGNYRTLGNGTSGDEKNTV